MNDKFAIVKKYNFWDKPVSDMGFLRTDYLEKIAPFLSNHLIKVLTGQRRCGKSYILRQIISKLIADGINPKNILYINLEFTDFDFLRTYSDLDNLVKIYRKAIKPAGKVYLFFDEIQNIKSWEKTINSLSQDYTDQYEIFITGSNSELLSGELSTYLSGRYIEFLISPFSYAEYIAHLQLENNKQNYLQYINTGGLPELFNLNNENSIRQYVSAVKDTILLRDIVQRYKIKDAKLLDDIFTYLINNASNLISVNNIVNYFKSKNRKTSYETVANYIHYLKNSFLIHQLERYNISGKEILSGTYKYYANDLSFKNYVYQGFSYGIGYKLENIIFLELLNSGFDIYVGYMRNKEVDFVAIKNSESIYIQVSYILIDKQTINREYSSLESISDNYEKIIVSLDDFNFDNKNGIKHIQAWNFHEYLSSKI